MNLPTPAGTRRPAWDSPVPRKQVQAAARMRPVRPTAARRVS